MNQLITDDGLFHWLRLVFCLTVVLIFSRICLLMRPISLFAGFICLHVGLFWKLSLWSFSVMNACRSVNVVNVHVSDDVFGFVVNSINGVGACFLVG